MRNVLIIGIGPGHPDYVTVQAVDALNRAQVLFVPDKGAEKEELRRVRHDICRRFIRHDGVRIITFEALSRRSDLAGYGETVAEWHGRIADQYARLLQEELGEDDTGGFLVWGDPSLYDSTLRIIETVRERGAFALDYEIIPGITSVQALAARHRIALNEIGGAVHITTGRQLAKSGPAKDGSTVVMLDGETVFTHLDRDDLDIFWGASIGAPDEWLVSGRLSDVKDEIARQRAEARHAKGWIMDTYLLRKRAER